MAPLGFDPWKQLLRLDLDDVRELPSHPRCHAGVWFLHPGPGTVREVRGLDAARSVEGVSRVRCRVGAGDIDLAQPVAV